ncbi:MAG TPA: phytanoyl-CoA dioxygenase family protein [Planctomycetes bacterium]|nr:phytanoyl-CoA dioxygenase family protein [Fuerstiella sp.]HIK95787.1 phytanoyl-CoA dioxygenase family protein [Planctomycetota bacterium]
MSITSEQVKFFEDHGYLTRLDVHDTSEAAVVREAFDKLELWEGRDECIIGLHGRHIDRRFIWELATNAKTLDCIAALMGPDIIVLSTHFFCKYPQTTDKFVAWHQDVTYWGLEPPDALTAWYAVDDSDVENGCMRVIPGSHRQGILPHGKSDRSGNLLSINQEIEADVDDGQAVDLVLKAGQISIHHGHLIHGSNPNHSERRRCGLAISYCPPHVKPVRANSLDRVWPAVLARGQDPFHHFGDWKLKFTN